MAGRVAPSLPTADEDWPAFLGAHSALPGPRANLELADAFAESAGRELILRLAGSADEYERFCGTQAIGRLIVEEPDSVALLTLLRERAGDEMWRVREGAARALQIVGDRDRQRLRSIVDEWSESPEPFVRRAAVAAICEPRLLTDPVMRAAALETCRRATRFLEDVPRSGRRAPDVRNLRQALGYCWSVAVASDAAAGLADFDVLRRSSDPDVAWIVASNLKKVRLRRVLGGSPAAPAV